MGIVQHCCVVCFCYILCLLVILMLLLLCPPFCVCVQSCKSWFCYILVHSRDQCHALDGQVGDLRDDTAC